MGLGNSIKLTTNVPKNATQSVNNSEAWLEAELQDPAVQLGMIEIFVVILAILLGCALIFGSLKRRSVGFGINYALLAARFGATSAAAYITGLVNETSFGSEILLMWCIVLYFLSITAVNVTARSFEENEEHRKLFFLKLTLPSTGLLVLLLFIAALGNTPQFWGAIVVLWVFLIFKLKEKKLALTYASRSYFGQPSTTRIINEYMKHEHEAKYDDDEPNPVSMKGYKYLVGVRDAVKYKLYDFQKPWDEVTKGMVTTEQIWQCEGSLLSKAKQGELKDVCLSFSLFWLLLRRFAGYPLNESSQDKTLKFVQYGLLSKDGNHERAFRVIEVELQFLYDYLYTNYFAMYVGGIKWLLAQVILITLYGSLVFLHLFHDKAEDINGVLEIRKVDTTVLVTGILTVGIILVEIRPIMVIFCSNWFKVRSVVYYVRKRIWEHPTFARYYEGMIRVIFHTPLFNSLWKPWQRKLGQYSLLDSYDSVPFLLRFECILYGYVDLPRKGRRKGKRIELSNQVKNAVASSLLLNGCKLYNGVASLCRNGVEIELAWACQMETDTDLIMAWHIATSMCEIATPISKGETYYEHSHIATSLSKYCGYLVTFHPRFLPDNECINYIALNKMVTAATVLLKGCRSKETKYNKMMEVSEEMKTRDDHVFEKGALLGKQLIHMPVAKRWMVLADFWAELILYLAPSDNLEVHAEFLSRGGEFITHLWALLTHAGILHRPEPTMTL